MFKKNTKNKTISDDSCSKRCTWAVVVATVRWLAIPLDAASKVAPGALHQARRRLKDMKLSIVIVYQDISSLNVLGGFWMLFGFVEKMCV